MEKTLAEKLLETTNGIEETGKDVPSEEELFGHDKRFEDVIQHILTKIEQKPKSVQANLYRQLMDRMIAGVVGNPMADRKLLQAAKDFWRYGFASHTPVPAEKSNEPQH